MKLIHLNVESFKYFDALVDFLEVEKPDILSIVEATDGHFFGPRGEKRDYLWELKQRFGWDAVFHPTVFRDFWDYQIAFGVAVLSRYPMKIEKALYLGEQEPTIRPHDHICFADIPKYERYPYAWKLNMPFLITQLQTEEWPLRLLTAHFHVSYECLETLQIWQDAEFVVKHLGTSADDSLPIIFTGDLNIRNESMSIKTLSEKLTQQSGNFTNTLCKSIHPRFNPDVDKIWLWIDHIFTRNITVSSCEVSEVEVSDHLPLVLDFSL